MKGINLAFILMVLLVLGGCQSVEQVYSPEEYIAWVNGQSHEWIQSKQLGTYRFEVFLHPKEYQILTQHRDTVLDAGTWANMISAPQETQYATLRIHSTDGQTPVLKNGISSQEAYQNRVAYLAFEAQKDIRISQNGTSHPCSLFHFERSFDLAPFITCLLAFPAFEEEGELVFEFNDQHFGNGPIRLNFSANRFSTTPTVKYLSYAPHISE